MRTRIALALGAAVFALAGGVACGGGGTPTPTPTTRPVTTPTKTPPPTVSASPPSSAATASTSARPISAEQQNATRAAQDYLAGQAFSRKGLIRQLSSSAGEGYSVKAATAAVDSLHVNWNEQAAQTAKDYLASQSFSRNGLIQQLESGAEGFTHSQAVYGVKAAGL